MNAAIGRILSVCAVTAAVLAVDAATGHAQTTLAGAVLGLKSSGAAAGSSWTLENNGYVGQFITLDAPGTVSISVQASGALVALLGLVCTRPIGTRNSFARRATGR